MENNKFINFWKFLELPMNSPLSHIKIAYINKFTEIEKSLNKNDKIYCPNDLIIANKAYEVLSDPYKRFLHNCEINGEEADLGGFYTNQESTRDLEEDLPIYDNEVFLAWLNSKINEYYNLSKNNESNMNIELIIYKKIAIGLNKNFIKLKEQLNKKKNKKKTLHK